ncbi:hypothetical protein [Streptomyces sp. TRM68367]|uniref:hypothetical protein n=1 Tax=Streptomyces sp. TRM68367 TaxID=2758415 RepID=UPI00165BE7A4|nr:hypothetical protein [Streptomyces sp. TRM68367]MBC9730620.1 hypothetical protein [Streptomyces sp. TRM68367]
MSQTKTDALRPRHRSAQRAAAVFGSLCVLVAAWQLLVTMPVALDRENDFRSAPACTSDGAGRDADCLWTVSARIDRTERVKGKKTATYWAYVTEADGTSTRTRFQGSAQEAPAATPGRQVEVTYWRGQIRYADFDGVRRYTNADPRGDFRIPCAIGLGLGFYGAGLLWVWYWYTRLSRRAGARVPLAGRRPSHWLPLPHGPRRPGPVARRRPRRGVPVRRPGHAGGRGRLRGVRPDLAAASAR